MSLVLAHFLKLAETCNMTVNSDLNVLHILVVFSRETHQAVAVAPEG